MKEGHLADLHACNRNVMENEISFREIREGINPTESENARM
jgi:hypothetical protein